MGRPTATPQRSTELTASCRKAPRSPKFSLSSGTEARQRLREKVVNLAPGSGTVIIARKPGTHQDSTSSWGAARKRAKNGQEVSARLAHAGLPLPTHR